MTQLLKHPDLKNILLFASTAIFIIACSLKAGELEKPAIHKPFSGIPVDATVLKPAVISDQLEVTGTILANQQVQIVSELTRKVVKVNVKEGSHVKQGTLLFLLDDADLQAQLERLTQQEKLAQLNEHRLKDLLTHDAIAQQDYDEVSTNLLVLQAQVRELEVAIAKTRITAPFDGKIGMINTHVGAVVSVNTVLTDIEDNSVVKIEFSVPEKYTNVIQEGSEHTFTTPSSDKTFTTKVIAKGASLSTDTRTLLVRGSTPNPHGRLLAGQSARITLGLHTSEDALAVSSQALIPSSGGYAVFVARNNKAQVLPVEIGQRSAASVEILEGLTAGDTVITSNLLRLSPGAPVSFATIE
ncbi:MAG: efflux RND transporter periplasmic adaptor subunit [Bacteroidota bacterium]|nr:efflux RND transporter periplasmic adaptor subunit [Bacteroidota bacterium]